MQKQLRDALGRFVNKMTKKDWDEAVQSYAEHLKAGYLKQSWSWRKGKDKYCNYHSLRDYLDKEENSAHALIIDEAMKANLHYWDRLGKAIASGSQKGEGWVWANNIFNRYRTELGWKLSDKNEVAQETEEQQQERKTLSDLAKEINKQRGN